MLLILLVFFVGFNILACYALLRYIHWSNDVSTVGGLNDVKRLALSLSAILCLIDS